MTTSTKCHNCMTVLTMYKFGCNNLPVREKMLCETFQMSKSNKGALNGCNETTCLTIFGAMRMRNALLLIKFLN